ncbi:hypothetical protein PoB_003641600 [Plakobranchus ocellatus]|uniref:Uncharacterized protein n=1 Tax=Plakobranchus ocellatus TaxID=259542 RepID=A0AAV4AFG2_9GAST|nr:hypothetical protein PoB_003641600 [Plakobranchus ocellatus]
MACANVPTPSSQDSDSDTIIAGSSRPEFDPDLYSDEDGPNGAQVASTLDLEQTLPNVGVAPLQLINELVISVAVFSRRRKSEPSRVENKLYHQTVGVMSSSEK